MRMLKYERDLMEHQLRAADADREALRAHARSLESEHRRQMEEQHASTMTASTPPGPHSTARPSSVSSPAGSPKPDTASESYDITPPSSMLAAHVTSPMGQILLRTMDEDSVGSPAGSPGKAHLRKSAAGSIVDEIPMPALAADPLLYHIPPSSPFVTIVTAPSGGSICTLPGLQASSPPVLPLPDLPLAELPQSHAVLAPRQLGFSPLLPVVPEPILTPPSPSLVAAPSSRPEGLLGQRVSVRTQQPVTRTSTFRSPFEMVSSQGEETFKLDDIFLGQRQQSGTNQLSGASRATSAAGPTLGPQTRGTSSRMSGTPTGSRQGSVVGVTAATGNTAVPGDSRDRPTTLPSYRGTERPNSPSALASLNADLDRTVGPAEGEGLTHGTIGTGRPPIMCLSSSVVTSGSHLGIEQLARLQDVAITLQVRIYKPSCPPCFVTNLIWNL